MTNAHAESRLRHLQVLRSISGASSFYDGEKVVEMPNIHRSRPLSACRDREWCTRSRSNQSVQCVVRLFIERPFAG
jgi:hypothetical protein